MASIYIFFHRRKLLIFAWFRAEVLRKNPPVDTNAHAAALVSNSSVAAS
jgi:hypothetical protein